MHTYFHTVHWDLCLSFTGISEQLLLRKITEVNHSLCEVLSKEYSVIYVPIWDNHSIFLFLKIS